MNQKKVYMAGAVKGLPYPQVLAKFSAKSEELQDKGFIVYNPVLAVRNENLRREVARKKMPPLNDEETRDETMRFCIGLLLECDELHLLPCWQDSQGARLERDIAMRLNIPIVYPS